MLGIGLKVVEDGALFNSCRKENAAVGRAVVVVVVND